MKILKSNWWQTYLSMTMNRRYQYSLRKNNVHWSKSVTDAFRLEVLKFSTRLALLVFGSMIFRILRITLPYHICLSWRSCKPFKTSFIYIFSNILVVIKDFYNWKWKSACSMSLWNKILVVNYSVNYCVSYLLGLCLCAL